VREVRLGRRAGARGALHEPVLLVRTKIFLKGHMGLSANAARYNNGTLPQYMPRIFTTNSQLTEEDHILPRRRNAKQQQLIAATARLVR
jgi:hypothetical protein